MADLEEFAAGVSRLTLAERDRVLWGPEMCGERRAFDWAFTTRHLARA